MCGIAGAVAITRPLAVQRLKPMVDALAERGPDDSGFLVWQSGKWPSRGQSYGASFNERRFRNISPLLPSIDTRAGAERLSEDSWDVFLGHRRLAIIDLSPRGHQPLTNKDQSLWIVYNGELYNYRELRSELESLGYSFVSKSDTEVLLHAYDAWGEDAVGRFNGMFAFAIWDVRRRLLVAARDRYGIKPLYYRQDSEQFLFASEIKSILAYLPQAPEVDPQALNSYFTFQNSLDDRTLFDGVRMLPAGSILRLDVATGRKMIHRYWDFDFRNESTQSLPQMEDELYGLIQQAVRRQCVSDVPIGSYLSGGLDSGAVAAITASVFGRIFTFTAGFDLSEAAAHEANFDERAQAEHMANLLRSEHYECVLHAGDMEEVLDKLVLRIEDLRVGQCYPNYYAARLVSKFVKVVMSGVGGDELFAGYPWRYTAALSDSPDWVGDYYKYWQRLIGDDEKQRFFNRDFTNRFRSDVGMDFGAHSLEVFRSVFPSDLPGSSRAAQVNRSLYFECKTFLHGLLMVEDKISMAFGLETRVPFLDNDLVDFACRIPVKYKLAGMEGVPRVDENLPRKKQGFNPNANDAGKTILRKTMQRILNPGVTERKKQGFSAPDESWFRGSSTDYIRDLLLSKDSRIGEFLDLAHVRRSLDDHVNGRVNKRLLIWSLVCFEWWMRKFQNVEASAVRLAA